jgi:acetylornithine/N-succinyldiaminopimelate aminotransferase
MAVAKGIGGGFPLGACLATEEAASGMKPGTHGTTYGGNPLAMAVGNAVLDVVLADGFLVEVRKKGLLLKQKLAGVIDRHPGVIEDVRGSGLMLGLKCRVTNTDLLAHFREAGVLAVGAGDNVLRIMPPLTITEAEIEEAVSRIEQGASAMEAELERGAAE